LGNFTEYVANSFLQINHRNRSFCIAVAVIKRFFLFNTTKCFFWCQSNI